MESWDSRAAKNYTIEDLECILDRLPYQVWLKDKDGKYTYVNKYCADKIGLDKDEIIGKDDFEFRNPAMAKKCNETDKILLQTHQDILTEEYNNINGEDVWHQVFKFMINENKFGGIAKEISLSKDFQEKLENNIFDSLEEEEVDFNNTLDYMLSSLKNIINCNNIDIFLYNENDKYFRRYIKENEEYILNNDVKIYIDKTLENKLKYGELQIDKNCKIYKSIIDIQKYKYEDNIKVKPIILGGNLFGLLCIHYDKNFDISIGEDSTITEILNKMGMVIKLIQSKSKISCIRKEKKELESMIKLESVKSDFLANISHEFRTPINIIDSTVQLLYKYNQVNNSSEKYEEYLNILKQNSNRILRLVDSVIDVAKLSNDFYDVSLRKGNIVQAIEEIAMSSVVYANENNRNIIFDTDQEEFNLAFDINKLEKIMLNLISNAIKFSYENTDIEVEINTELDKEKIFVFVRNNGPKIPESERERIFEKFTQINNLFVRESEGSGIGLFLVKKFIELHEGEIYVEDVGEITQFTFYLPKKSSKENEVLEDKKIMDKSILDKCDIAFSDI